MAPPEWDSNFVGLCPNNFHLFSLISAPGGMGKSTTMKHFAISWADETSEELKKFDFVFHISLKHVKNNSPIENIIIAQHNGLKAKDNGVTQAEIRLILTEQKVLLLLDGYDEFKAGINPDIDDTIKKERLWKAWVVLTSRETEPVKDIKKYMSREVEIKGFNEENVETYTTACLESSEKKDELLEKARAAGLGDPQDWGLLTVPIFLQIVCILFLSNLPLPKTRAGLLQAIVDRCMNREAIRLKGKKAEESAKKALYKLGKLAWEGLKKRGQKLIFTKVNTIKTFLFYHGTTLDVGFF